MGSLQFCEGKGKVALVHAMKAYGRVESSLSFLAGQFTAKEIVHVTHQIGGLVCPRASFYILESTKIYYPCHAHICMVTYCWIPCGNEGTYSYGCLCIMTLPLRMFLSLYHEALHTLTILPEFSVVSL